MVRFIITLTLFISVKLNAQDSFLEMLKKAPNAGIVKCTDKSQIASHIYPFPDKDTIKYKFNTLPNIPDFVSVQDSIRKGVEEVVILANKTPMEVDSIPFDLLINFKKIDGKGGTLAHCHLPFYPSLYHQGDYQIMTFDFYDLPVGINSPLYDEYIKLYGTPNSMKRVARHEMGHFFGARHSEERDSHMFWIHNNKAEWSKNDLKWFKYNFPKNDYFVLRKFGTERVNKYFSTKEFIHNCGQDKRVFIYKKVFPAMTMLRVIYNTPIYITSAYRDPECNRKSGGVKVSYHTIGKAVDFKFKTFEAYQKFVNDFKNKHGWLRVLLKAHSVGAVGLYDGNRVHIDFRPLKPNGDFAFWDNRGKLIINDHECGVE